MSAATITNAVAQDSSSDSDIPGLSPVVKLSGPIAASREARPIRSGKAAALEQLQKFTGKARSAVNEDSFTLSSDDDDDDDDNESGDASSCDSSSENTSSVEDCSSHVSVVISENSPTAARPDNFVPQSSVSRARAGFTFVNNKPKPNRTVAPPPSTAMLHAAAAAAPGSGNSNVAPAAAAAPVNLNTPTAFWLRNQAKVGPGTVVKACLRQHVTLEDGSTTEVSRTHYYFGAAHIDLVPSSTKEKIWVDAVNLLSHSGIPHSGFVSGFDRSGKNAKNRRSAKVMSFRAAHFAVLETPTADGKLVPLRCESFFPPVDNTISQFTEFEILSQEDGDTFKNSCLARPDLLNCEAGRLAAMFGSVPAPVTDEFARAEGGRLGSNLWTQHECGLDDVRDAILNLGHHNYKTLRVLPEHFHAPFANLCSRSFKYDRSMSVQDRARAALTLIAIPSNHLRDDLHGQHSSKRDVYLRLQLSGMVCDLTNAKPTTTSAPRPEAGSFESAAKRAADVLSLAAQGRISAANKRLHRSDAPRVPIEQTVADLVKLHPDGEDPIDIELPNPPLHDEASITVAAVRKTVSASCKETTPGPDGWTQELLKVALTDASFAESFRNLIVDICNGAMPDEVDAVLTLSNLVGIPKDTGGTRPIAMGQTILKVAAAIAVKREAKQLINIFDGTQYGCAVENGGEVVIHNLRGFVRTGKRVSSDHHAGKHRVWIGLDAHNAFNSPHRPSMYNAIRHYGLLGLIGIFKTTYAKAAKMFVVGSQGKYTVSSKRGSRQGEVSASVAFAVTIQPGIDNIRDNHPNVDIQAYLDDISLLCEDLESALKALIELTDFFEQQGIKLNFKKCELIMPGLVNDGPAEEYEARVAEAFAAAGVPADSPLHQFRVASCVKVLGANIGTTSEAEEAALYSRIRPKFDDLLERLREVPASPQAFTLLRQCVLPSLTHIARVHHPDVTKNLMVYADAQVQLLLQQWAQSKAFSIPQQAFVSAPLKEGGLGIASAAVTAPAAYAASVLAYNAHTAGKKSEIKQKHINQACQQEYAIQLANMDPSVAIHLESTKAAGSALLAGPTARASEDVSGAYLRLVTLSASENAASASDAAYTCPGCNSVNIGKRAHNLTSTGNQRSALLPLKKWMCHVVGCAAIPGGAVTKRHNAIVDYLCLRLRNAGYSNVVKEPRTLRQYNCSCGLHLDHNAYVEHAKVCNKATENVRTQGPDILFTNAKGETLALDVRVVNELAPSHQGKPLEALFHAAETEKANKYAALCHDAGAQLLTFGVSALGAISNTSAAILKSIANDSALDFKKLCNRVGCLAAAGSAHALLTAESLVAIRPKPRVLALAAIKLISKNLGLPIASVPGAIERLGVPAPSNEDLAAQVRHLTDLAARLEDSLTAILQRAQAVKIDDAAEHVRAEAAEDPFFGLRNSRIPSIAPTRNKPSSSPRTADPPGPSASVRQEVTAQAQHQLRIDAIANEKRELSLRYQEVDTLINADLLVRGKSTRDSLQRAADSARADNSAFCAATAANVNRLNEEAKQREEYTAGVDDLFQHYLGLRNKLIDGVQQIVEMDNIAEELTEEMNTARAASVAAYNEARDIVARGKADLDSAVEAAADTVEQLAEQIDEFKTIADDRDARIRAGSFISVTDWNQAQEASERRNRRNQLNSVGSVLGQVNSRSSTPASSSYQMKATPLAYTNNNFAGNNNNYNSQRANPPVKARPSTEQVRERSAPSQKPEPTSSISSRQLTYSSTPAHSAPSQPRAPSQTAPSGNLDYVQQRIANSQAQQQPQRQASRPNSAVSDIDLEALHRENSRAPSRVNSRASSVASSGLRNEGLNVSGNKHPDIANASPAPYNPRVKVDTTHCASPMPRAGSHVDDDSLSYESRGGNRLALTAPLTYDNAGGSVPPSTSSRASRATSPEQRVQRLPSSSCSPLYVPRRV